MSASETLEAILSSVRAFLKAETTKERVAAVDRLHAAMEVWDGR